LVFLVALLILVAAAPAHAYNAPGPRWPGDTIRYHDTLPKSWNSSIDAAVRTWNRSGADIRFRKVPRARAQVIIGYGNLGSAAGLATIGRNSGAFVRINSLLYRPLRERDRVFAAQVLAHELGHVLGLYHVRSNNCRLMSTPPLTYCPSPPEPWLYDCQWLSKDDIRGVVHLYGRKRGEPPPQYCLREPMPSQLGDLRITADTPPRIVWEASRDWLPGTRVVVDVFEPARCAGDTTASPLATLEVAAARGKVRAWTGPYCYEVRVQNRYGLANDVVRVSAVDSSVRSLVSGPDSA
jgi:hypothetical protein